MKCNNEGPEILCPVCRKKRKYFGRLVHDLRRTGIRNMTFRGIPRSVIKKFSGHKTDATFEYYNIADGIDMSEALQKLAASQS